jgi:hypothetical protein
VGGMAIERMAAATCRDRTSEFLAIAERLSKQQGKVRAPSLPGARHPAGRVSRGAGWE